MRCSDREPEPDAGVIVAAGALDAPLERLDERRDQVRGMRRPVFSTTSASGLAAARACARRPVPPNGRLCTIALCTRFVTSCCSSAGEPSIDRRVARDLDRHAAPLGERQQRLDRLLREQREIDGSPG